MVDGHRRSRRRQTPARTAAGAGGRPQAARSAVSLEGTHGGLSRRGSGIADDCPSYANYRSMAVRASTAAWVKMALDGIAPCKVSAVPVDRWTHGHGRLYWPCRCSTWFRSAYDSASWPKHLRRCRSKQDSGQRRRWAERPLIRTARCEAAGSSEPPGAPAPKILHGHCSVQFQAPVYQTPIGRRGAAPRRWIRKWVLSQP